MSIFAVVNDADGRIFYWHETDDFLEGEVPSGQSVVELSREPVTLQIGNLILGDQDATLPLRVEYYTGSPAPDDVAVPDVATVLVPRMQSICLERASALMAADELGIAMKFAIAKLLHDSDPTNFTSESGVASSIEANALAKLQKDATTVQDAIEGALADADAAGLLTWP